MISLPKPPKPPGRYGNLGAWKEYLGRLQQWVHVMEQLKHYELHKYAVRNMNLQELQDDGHFRTPKYRALQKAALEKREAAYERLKRRGKR